MIKMIPFVSLIIAILLSFSPHSTVSGFVLDVNYNPVYNSASKYYIISKGHGGSLALTHRAGETPCPGYITRKPTSHGIPVTISSPLRILYLPTSTRVDFAFRTNLTTCTGPLVWHVTTDSTTGQLFVVSGRTPTAKPGLFTIREAESGGKVNNVYKIRYCVSVDGEVDDEKCGDVGFYQENGLMGITNENPLFAQFKEVNGNSGWFQFY